MFVSTAVISGTKTVTQNASPGNTAAALTAILAKAPENLSCAELAQLQDALRRVAGGGTPSNIIGNLLV